MRLVFTDPLMELKSLIEIAEADPTVSHIAITASELRACLKHKHVGQVLPVTVNERLVRLNLVKRQKKLLLPMLAGTVLTDEQKMPLFDQQDALELAEYKIQDELPSTIEEGNIIIKVSMR